MTLIIFIIIIISSKSSTFLIKGKLCEVPFFGGSTLVLFYSVGAMGSCNYIPQVMLNNIF